MTPVIIEEVFSPKTVEHFRNELLRDATWEDGQKTAGPLAASVKRNLQAREDHVTSSLRAMAVHELREHALFNALVMPRDIGIMFSRYDAPTGCYGKHVDGGYMGSGATRIRRDVSFTIMLSTHDEYDGGALSMDDGGSLTMDELNPAPDRPYRLKQGAGIVYPATTIHEVTPVTRGSRLVIVGWARSYIRDAAQRELLFELEVAKASLADKHGKTDEIDLLSKCAANLHRMWMED